MWYLENGELIEIKANKQAIGLVENPVPFTTYNIEVKPGTVFYLFTDGYADQFNDSGKKLMKKRFKELLLSIQDKTLTEQGSLLDDLHLKWKGKMEQTDDVTVFGLRL